jgi:hypothetical protein
MITATYKDRIGRKVELTVFDRREDSVYQEPNAHPWVLGEYHFYGKYRVSRDCVWGFKGSVSQVLWRSEREDAIRLMGQMTLDSIDGRLRCRVGASGSLSR